MKKKMKFLPLLLSAISLLLANGSAQALSFEGELRTQGGLVTGSEALSGEGNQVGRYKFSGGRV